MLAGFSLVETFPWNYYRELDRQMALDHAAASSGGAGRSLHDSRHPSEEVALNTLHDDVVSDGAPASDVQPEGAARGAAKWGFGIGGGRRSPVRACGELNAEILNELSGGSSRGVGGDSFHARPTIGARERRSSEIDGGGHGGAAVGWGTRALRCSPIALESVSAGTNRQRDGASTELANLGTLPENGSQPDALGANGAMGGSNHQPWNFILEHAHAKVPSIGASASRGKLHRRSGSGGFGSKVPSVASSMVSLDSTAVD